MTLVKIKNLVIGVLLWNLMMPNSAQAQFNSPWSQWINASQIYYKIPVIQDGVYRLTQTDLAAAGISGINPQHFQLFHRGIEHALFINGENDGSFDADDYIEFYGKRNDGTLDADTFIYSPATRQVNKYYNLYSDTTAYFLTWTLDGTSGKRMEIVDEPYVASPTPYQWKEELLVFSDQYSAGQNFPANSQFDIYNSIFDNGEGWTSTIIGSGQSRNFTIPISSLYNPNFGGVAPILEVVMVGANKSARYRVEVRVGNATNNLRLINTVELPAGAPPFTKTIYRTDNPIYDPLSINDLDGTGNFTLRLTTTQGAIRIAYIKLIYPQTTNLQNANTSKIGIPDNLNDITYLNITNPPANARILDIGRLDAVRRVNYALVGGNLQFALTHTTPTVANPPIQNTLLIDNGAFLSPAFGIRPVSFQNLNPASHDYLIITHPKLRTSVGNVEDVVEAYSQYRASPAGGGFNPLIVNVNELYNQFTYGEKTPLAIRRFAEYMYANGDPRFIFIIGSSLSLPDQYFRPGVGFFRDIRKDFEASQQDLVPTSGFPPADNRYVQGLGNLGTTQMLIAIGRLPTSEPQEVFNYLNKVIEHESPGCNEALWRKNAIHLSGGNTPPEQSTFKNNLATLARAFTDTLSSPPPISFSRGGLIGGRVFVQSKSTTSPQEVVNISELVNNGVSLITFFGHSAIGLTDIEIGRASDPTQGYNNKGRYPVMLTNGCQLGSVFYGLPTLSQDWLFTADKGAIAFLGHSYIGYSGPLNTYSRWFYDRAFTLPSLAGKSIGEIIQSATAPSALPSSTPNSTTADQMVLQGDPAVKLFLNDKPDYAIDNESIFIESIDGDPVSDLSQAFNLKLVVSNLGIIDQNKRRFSISVRRTYANGETTVFSTPAQYNTVYYQDTLSVTVFREEGISSFGLNTFEVTIDSHQEDEALDNLIEECNELNNKAIFEFIIPTVGVRPITPLEFSIASAQPVTLTALAGNADGEAREIIFEIDTVATFDSPAKQNQIVPPTNNPVWAVDLLTDNAQDSTVYYWRVNVASAVNDPSILWGESSFTYIKDSPEGWAQKQFHQFRKNTLTNLIRNTENETWQFTPSIDQGLLVRTYGNDFEPTLPYVYFRYQGDAFVTSVQNCGQGIVAFRFTATGQVFPPTTIAGTTRCGRDNLGLFFSNTALQNNRLANYIDQAAEDDFILLFTIGTVNFSTWTPEQKAVLQILGGNPNLFNTLATGQPYVIFGKKGYTSGEAVEAIAFSDPLSSEIQINPAIAVLSNEGEIVSTLIGPAQNWKEIIHQIDTEEEDSHQLDLYGVTLQNQESPAPLIENITEPVRSLADIDPEQYPYLRLKLKVRDDAKRTPPQLKQWIVIYDGVPEGLIDVEAAGFNAYQILPKTEGELIPLNFVFRNISSLEFDSDSLQVNVTLNSQLIKTFNIKAPAPRDITQFRDTISTLGLVGENQLIVFVNPRIVPEAFYENNTISIPFLVNNDNINPVLEVAFDGRRILDGEIVSPEPLIGITVRDENQFLDTSDPSKITFSLKKPCEGCGFEEIDLAQNNLSWSFENGVLKVDYQPERLQDGIHTIRVQGRDAADNRAGTEPYTINFEVVNESSITHFYPYPNPFSTSARFVFTLTGSEVPAEMKIQIMTVSGKVVREITQDEIGPIRIGNNLTEYAWDGRDEFGDVLANGVYLYRVMMGNTQNNFKARATAGDKAFKNGYGKLYILR